MGHSVVVGRPIVAKVVALVVHPVALRSGGMDGTAVVAKLAEQKAGGPQNVDRLLFSSYFLVWTVLGAMMFTPLGGLTPGP